MIGIVIVAHGSLAQSFLSYGVFGLSSFMYRDSRLAWNNAVLPAQHVEKLDLVLLIDFREFLS